MTFEEFLEKRGVGIKLLAAMPSEDRERTATTAFQDWLHGEGFVTSEQLATFAIAWQTCQDVMAYAHMAQDARADEEKLRTPTEILRRSKLE